MHDRKLRLIRSVVGAVLMLGAATPLLWVRFGSTYGLFSLLLGAGIAVTATMQAISYVRLKREQENKENKDEKRSS